LHDKPSFKLKNTSQDNRGEFIRLYCPADVYIRCRVAKKLTVAARPHKHKFIACSDTKNLAHRFIYVKNNLIWGFAPSPTRFLKKARQKL